MSVRSFHSVFMATAVAGAALGCYLVSLRVASERAALESVESQIVSTQSDIRMLQTEVGTRARLTQLERWNVRALSLSAPTAGQILGDKFQLARLVRPEPKLEVEAPVVLASAPAPQPTPALGDSDPDAAPVSDLLHEASYAVPKKPAANASGAQPEAVDHHAKAAQSAAGGHGAKAGDKAVAPSKSAVTKPVRTAKVDPLAPLPTERSTTKAARTTR